MMEPDQSIAEQFAPPDHNPLRDPLHPVTIFQMQQLESSGNSLMTQGRKLAAVALVAHVTHIKRSAAAVKFSLEDGTGKITAEKVLDSVRYQQSAEDEEEEVAEYMSFEDAYVEVIGQPSKDNPAYPAKIDIKYIHLVNGYNQVMHHILHVMHRELFAQQQQGFEPSGDMDIMLVDDVQADEDDSNLQCPIACALPPPPPASPSPPILSKTFSPQRHHPLATLEPLGRVIMKHMHHQGNSCISIAELAESIQGSSGCTESEFNLVLEALLSEAYLTSPLDDGYVVVTPRH